MPSRAGAKKSLSPVPDCARPSPLVSGVPRSFRRSADRRASTHQKSQREHHAERDPGFYAPPSLWFRIAGIHSRDSPCSPAVLKNSLTLALSGESLMKQCPSDVAISDHSGGVSCQVRIRPKKSFAQTPKGCHDSQTFHFQVAGRERSLVESQRAGYARKPRIWEKSHAGSRCVAIERRPRYRHRL